MCALTGRRQRLSHCLPHPRLVIYMSDLIGSDPPSIRAGQAGHHFPLTGDHDKTYPFYKCRLQLLLAQERCEYVNLSKPVFLFSACLRPSGYKHAYFAASIVNPGLNCAPVGTTPCSTYRHSATSSLRASATIPTRPIRLPAPPNQARYHFGSALSG